MIFTIPSHVSLKVVQCVLFVFFNRAQRILRGSEGSSVVAMMDLSYTAIFPLLLSASIHTAMLCPAFISPTRCGRVSVLYALLHVLLLHALAVLLVVTFLQKYFTTASFLSVLLTSHICFMKPLSSDLVPAQKLSYGRLINCSAYVLPVLCWVILPVLRVHEIEAIAPLYVPDALCFAFAFALQFTTLMLNVAVAAICSLCTTSR